MGFFSKEGGGMLDWEAGVVCGGVNFLSKSSTVTLASKISIFSRSLGKGLVGGYTSSFIGGGCESALLENQGQDQLIQWVLHLAGSLKLPVNWKTS